MFSGHDYNTTETVDIPFNTFSSDDPSASVTATNLAAGDIKIHKDGSVTQRSSASGVTVSVDFDGITGCHIAHIDLSDNTDAGYYANGSRYQVRVEGITVDAATLNPWIGAFSVGCTLRPAIDGRTIGVESDGDLTKVNTLDGHTAQSANNNIILAHADYGNAKLVRSTTPANKLDISSTGEAGLDFANIKNATGAHTLTNITVPVCATNSDMRGTDGANTTVPDVAGTAATPAEVATALSNINLDHLCKTATAGADMTAEVVDNSVLSRILANGDTSAFDPTSDGLQLIRDRGDAAWTTGAGGSDRLLMVDTTIATLASQTSFTLTAGSADDNAYRNCTIVIEDASTATQKAVGLISAYTGGTKTVTLKYNPAIFTMAPTDKVYILAENALKSTLANRQLNVAADGDIAGNIDGSVASLAGHTAQTGDGYAILDNGTHGSVAIETLVDEIETILKNATYGNSALQVLIAALQEDLDNGNDGLGALKALIEAVPTASEIQTEIEANGASVIDTIRDYIENVTYGLSALKTLIDGVPTTAEFEARSDLAGTAATLHGTTDGKIDTNKSELDGLQGADGKCLISTNAQDLSGSLDVNTKTATATALDLILKDSTFALAIADAIWDEILTGATHNLANSGGRRVREIGAFAIESGTAQAGTLNSIKLAATTSLEAGTINRNLIVLTDNTGRGQTRTIVDWDAIEKVAIVDRDWRVIPDNTTAYQVVPDDTPLTVDHGIAQGGTSTTIKIREYASSVNNAYWCNIVGIIAGKGRGQARLVGSYNGTTKVITICGENWVEIPDTTSVYVMMPYGTTCTACLTDSALALINTEIDNALNTAIPGSPTADSINEKIKALPSGIAKNVALPNLDIYMLLEDGITAATGKTVTGQIRKDAGSFTGLTNAITEVSGGLYTIADGITQAEMNADKVTLRFTATDCRDTIMMIYPT